MSGSYIETILLLPSCLGKLILSELCSWSPQLRQVEYELRDRLSPIQVLVYQNRFAAHRKENKQSNRQTDILSLFFENMD